MNEVTKRTFNMILSATVSMITGYGMFWHYQLDPIFSVFTNMKIGMFASAMMMVVLSSIWNKPYIAPTKQIKQRMSKKALSTK